MTKKKSTDLSNRSNEKKPKKVKEKIVKSADRDPSVTLNVQQEEAIVKLKEFLKNDEKEFTIMGAGGCVDNQTEYLSSTGWNKISNYKGEEIAIYDKGNLKFELPIEHVCYPASDWYELNTKYGISQKLSEEHRVPYITSKGNLKVRSMKEIYDMHQQSKLGFTGKYITSFNPINGYEIDMTDDYLRLLVAASADGYCQTLGKGQILQWTFRLKKERKCTRIEMLLDKCDIEYKKRYQESTGFNIYTFYLENAFKVFPDIWYRLCKKQLQVICDEVVYWDGRYNGNSYYSTIKQNADFIQYCFSSCGYRSTIQKDNHRNKTCYIVNRSNRILVGMIGDNNFKPKILITKPLENEFKYCFKTSTSFWVARRNGKIFITGNTGKTFLIQELFKRKKQNSNEFYVPSTVIGVCVTHMARLNLMKSIPNTTTYASATNLVMAFDPMGNVYFMEKYTNHNFSELKMYKFIVVDECSMFDKKMKANLIKCCSPSAKIIFLGDNAQLPPIEAEGNHDSPTFDVPSKYELTIKMRQDDDDHIAILGDEVREHIFGDHDLTFLNNITQQWDPEKGKGYSITTLDKVIPSYVKNFKAGMDVRITSYRNSRIKQLNAMVRRVLWEDKASEQFVPGEFIVMDDQYSPNREVLAYCGQTFKIIKIYVEIIDFVECHMIVVPRWNGTNGANETVTLAVPTDKGIVFYKRHLEDLKALAISTKDWSAYKAFKDQFSNVSYAYAMNNYKIQGSTITGCYVDLSDILDVKPISNKRKLQAFYVGISRPTDFCAIFNLLLLFTLNLFL